MVPTLSFSSALFKSTLLHNCKYSAVSSLASSLCIFGKFTFFDAFNYLTAKFIMPLSGIVLCLFVGWRMGRRNVREELSNHGALHIPDWMFGTFIFFLRWIAPLSIALIFINELGLF